VLSVREGKTITVLVRRCTEDRSPIHGNVVRVAAEQLSKRTVTLSVEYDLERETLCVPATVELSPGELVDNPASFHLLAVEDAARGGHR
jgi:hypothetical protein